MDKIHTLLGQFGYSQFKPLQLDALQCLLDEQDVLLIAPTGGGKSLVYQMASILRDGVGIIICPLLALMSQQVEQLRQQGIRAEFLNSSLNPGEQDDLVWALRHKQVDILFLSPEKFIQPSVMGFLSHIDIALFAVDEAHCITHWGTGFRPEYGQLNCIRRTFPSVPIVAMTGTADAATKKEIVTSLELDTPKILTASFNRPNIEMIISQKRQGQKQLLHFLIHEVPGKTGIIYCRSKKKVQLLSSALNAVGINSRYYHSAMTDAEKKTNADYFYQESGVVMVATTAFGMGIDVADVRFIVHMDLPNSIEAYFQEVGRAGRDGLPAKALLLYGLQDLMQLAYFELEGARSGEQGADLDLLGLFGFLEARGCRRKALLDYFDEHIDDCGNCDRCLHPKSEQNVSIAAQKMLSLIYHTKGRVNVSTLIQVLLGKPTKAVKALALNQLSLFGKGRELTELSWKSLFRKLMAMGCIQIVRDGEFDFALTENARKVLKGAEQVVVTCDYHMPVLLDDAIESDTSVWLALMRWYHDRQKVVGFSASHLRQIALSKPNTLASLSRLTGVPVAQLESGHGLSLLALLQDTNRLMDCVQ